MPKKKIRRRSLPAITNATTAYSVVHERWHRRRDLAQTIPLVRQAIAEARPIAPYAANYLARALKSLIGAHNHADGMYRRAQEQAKKVLGRELQITPEPN